MNLLQVTLNFEIKISRQLLHALHYLLYPYSRPNVEMTRTTPFRQTGGIFNLSLLLDIKIKSLPTYGCTNLVQQKASDAPINLTFTLILRGKHSIKSIKTSDL